MRRFPVLPGDRPLSSLGTMRYRAARRNAHFQRPKVGNRSASFRRAVEVLMAAQQVKQGRAR